MVVFFNSGELKNGLKRGVEGAAPYSGKGTFYIVGAGSPGSSLPLEGKVSPGVSRKPGDG